MVAADLSIETPWYDLAWYEWLGVIGTVGGLVGLLITWFQARGARTAARAALEAVSGTQDELRSNHLLMQVGQLRWITSALDDAVSNNNPATARLMLDNWRFSAGQLHGVLTNDPSVGGETLSAVQESLGQAFTAASTILANPNRKVANSCKEARGAINSAIDTLNKWAGQRSHQVSPPTGGTS